MNSKERLELLNLSNLDYRRRRARMIGLWFKNCQRLCDPVVTEDIFRANEKSRVHLCKLKGKSSLFALRKYLAIAAVNDWDSISEDASESIWEKYKNYLDFSDEMNTTEELIESGCFGLQFSICL